LAPKFAIIAYTTTKEFVYKNSVRILKNAEFDFEYVEKVAKKIYKKSYRAENLRTLNYNGEKPQNS
jgi:hypothetical protein